MYSERGFSMAMGFKPIAINKISILRTQPYQNGKMATLSEIVAFYKKHIPNG